MNAKKCPPQTVRWWHKYRKSQKFILNTRWNIVAGDIPLVVSFLIDLIFKPIIYQGEKSEFE